MDGVPSGWVVALVDHGEVRWRVVSTAEEVLAVTEDRVAVGVDIPLGLPAGRDRRICDDRAADRLGRARSSVFPAPPRPVLAAVADTRATAFMDAYADACDVARNITGRKISLQTFHIAPKIDEWDRVELPARVVEVHPELSFRTLAREIEFEPKRTVRGAGQRIAALDRWIDVAAALGDLPEGAAMNDVLDALAAAWSAERQAAGRAETLGGDLDERGRVMRVVV